MKFKNKDLTKRNKENQKVKTQLEEVEDSGVFEISDDQLQIVTGGVRFAEAVKKEDKFSF